MSRSFRLLWSLVVPCAYLSLLLTLVLLLLLLGLRVWLQGRRKARRAQDGGPAVAFFHPYCSAGGGGERVLWCSLRALMNRYTGLSCPSVGLMDLLTHLITHPQSGYMTKRREGKYSGLLLK